MDLSLIVSLANGVLLIVVLVLVLRRAGAAGGMPDVEKPLAAVRDELSRAIANSQSQVDVKLEAFRASLDTSAATARKEASDGRIEVQTSLTEGLARVNDQLQALTRNNAEKVAQMQENVQSAIEKMQKSNEEKLEKMRETVDEKLQGTLEKRLGESFKLVSENLESVQRGLGEMQQLASGVGDLKRVLTNVKNRGGWGEVQLSRQLEDMLTPDQFEANVKIKSGSNELVEFAVKLPGRQDGEFVYLPIDSKFPQEDYERLLAAQELGDPVAVEAAAKNVEKSIKAQAKIIRDKYIDVPKTTDFAIMYLPTEGLFAEVIRRPGLANELQNAFRVQVTGPTTLMSLLNSLQMGFKTLAIEKSTSDVWKILSAAKAEFQKYGQVWDKLSKQLSTAQNTVSEAGRRTRAVERTLRTVETNGAIEASPEFVDIEELVGDIDDIETEESSSTSPLPSD